MEIPRFSFVTLTCLGDLCLSGTNRVSRKGSRVQQSLYSYVALQNRRFFFAHLEYPPHVKVSKTLIALYQFEGKLHVERLR
jgi:hypothetical protein